MVLQRLIQYEIVANLPEGPTRVCLRTSPSMARAEREMHNLVDKQIRNGKLSTLAKIVQKHGWDRIQFNPIEIVYRDICRIN